jgi:hypothetical protein
MLDDSHASAGFSSTLGIRQAGVKSMPAWGPAAAAAAGCSDGASLPGAARCVCVHSSYVRAANGAEFSRLRHVSSENTDTLHHMPRPAIGRCSKPSGQQLYSVVRCLHRTFCILRHRPGGVPGGAAAAAPLLAAAASPLPASWAAGCAAATSCRSALHKSLSDVYIRHHIYKCCVP